MQEVYELISKASASEANVIIYGESGTGKDLVAHTIHEMSDRRKKAIIPVNCGSIQESLFEREFFGHRKGAFTGALRDQPGFFDAAHEGTLFLDEIGELPLSMQVKLLRAIEGGGYTPVGAQSVKHADVRIIAATNRDLKQQVKQGKIRKDFFYRINVIAITVPPLRERREDIPLLIDHFLKRYSHSDSPPELPGRILESLYKRDWSGNIRQLQNVLQRYLTLKQLDVEDDPPEPAQREADPPGLQEDMELREALDDFEKRFILNTLKQHRGHRKKTAATLGIPLRTLQRKLKKYHLIKDDTGNHDT
jgi:transcriptional regulator with PAS, ATPase and Fis domain